MTDHDGAKAGILEVVPRLLVSLRSGGLIVGAVIEDVDARDPVALLIEVDLGADIRGRAVLRVVGRSSFREAVDRYELRRINSRFSIPAVCHKLSA